jgi:hypothetical protein
MTKITIYSIRSDMVFGGGVEIEVTDAVRSPIPAGHTRVSPHPIPAGHYAVMQGGWKYVKGVAPEYKEPEPYIDPKLTGVEILGVMCSATREDQNGLTAVAMGVTLARMNGQVFPATKFYFANGNSLTITDENFDAIYAIWTPFRQSFFVPE